MANPIRISLMSILLGTLLAGCAGNGQQADHKWEDRQIPAPKEPAKPPAARDERLDPSLQTAARAELNAALASNDPFVRMHAVEAAQNTIGNADKSIYVNALKDSAPQVRFAGAMAAGRLQISQAKPTLEQMINDEDPLMGIAVRFALHRMGNTTYSKDLEKSARDPQWQVRATTAIALGLMEEPTAARVLLPMLHDAEAPVRLQAAEALWRLGNANGLRALVAGVSSAYADDQMVSILALAGPKDRRVLGHVRGALTDDHTEVGLVAARAVGMCGSDEGYVIAVDGTKSKDPRQRSLAALALGAIGRSDAQSYLGNLLKDKDAPDVRLSAAQALLQLKPSGTSARGE